MGTYRIGMENFQATLLAWQRRPNRRTDPLTRLAADAVHDLSHLLANVDDRSRHLLIYRGITNDRGNIVLPRWMSIHAREGTPEERVDDLRDRLGQVAATLAGRVRHYQRVLPDVRRELGLPASDEANSPARWPELFVANLATQEEVFLPDELRRAIEHRPDDVTLGM
jgi:hypothetical protein